MHKKVVLPEIEEMLPTSFLLIPLPNRKKLEVCIHTLRFFCEYFLFFVFSPTESLKNHIIRIVFEFILRRPHPSSCLTRFVRRRFPSRYNREKRLYTRIVHTFLLYFTIKHNSALFFSSPITVFILLNIF